MSDRWSPSSGDLIYVPSEVNLVRHTPAMNPGLGGNVVTDFLKLDAPATMLVSDAGREDSSFVEVIYRGTKWNVDSRETYPVINR
jgi:hypothetical protein